MSKMERRFIASEVRAETQDGKKVLTGYAAKYGKMSQDLGGFNEIIAPGTFDRAVKENQDVKMLINHDPNQIVGRNGKNLELTSDKTGLKFRVTLPNTQVANDLHENVRNGIMEQCSFGFVTKGDRWMDARDGGFKDVQYEGVEDKQALVRELNDVDLRDVSVVTSPAYPSTEVKARDKGVSALELRSLFPDGIPEEVAKHMATRAGKTKSVSGQDVAMSDFAYVGDPDDTSTWKFPVHDKSHAQNALARWGQAKGISADKKDAVYKKIVSAAKKFGVDVSEEKALQEAFEKRHDKVADISALAPKILECMDSLEDCLGDAKDSIDDGDLDSFDSGKGDLQTEVKALIALLNSLEKAVDKEVEEGKEDDGGRAMRLRLVETALNM
jgi:HK97 family phage prohead protease